MGDGQQTSNWRWELEEHLILNYTRGSNASTKEKSKTIICHERELIMAWLHFEIPEINFHPIQFIPHGMKK